MTNWVGQGWSIDVDQSGLRVVGPRRSFDLDAAEAESVTLRRGLLGWKLRGPARRPKRIRGMTRLVAAQVRVAIALLSLEEELRGWVRRYDDVRSACEQGVGQGRWVPWDVRDAFLAGRNPDFPARLQRSGAVPMLSERDNESLAFGPDDMALLVDRANQRILTSELSDRGDFFGTIESRPLTDEQARAVVTFDNRVQVLAAAGSGKTSVMVARAAYAVARGFVRPERILLLAFNAKAAKELQERVKDRFKAAGLSSSGVRASTFHSFGLSVIGQATGRKPSVAQWIESGGGTKKISELVERLRASDKTFRYQWDLYRLVFAPVPIKPGRGTPDGYDRKKRESGYETLKGDLVRSHGERMVANWLFINGVNYEYEKPYVIDVADAKKVQYRPDFYYPDIDAWHEHWALDREGDPPVEFEGYAEAMVWKRRIHARYGTDLIETTFAEIVLGDGGFGGLEEALVSRGITLDWNADRICYETLKGDLVGSKGERMIADWLFINGVNYEYEKIFRVDVADADHGRYKPAFYYPDIDTWHEHWALDKEGNPPAEFEGYAEAMAWKRSLHGRYGTDLIETTLAEIVLGEGGFSGLEDALVWRGITLDRNPIGKPANGPRSAKEPVSHEQMVKLIRTFLSHVKSSGASRESLQGLLSTTRRQLAGARTRVFLDIFWPLFDAWNEELQAAEGGPCVDFDDMLGRAADLIAGGYDPGCDLVLVDEFQDSSQARARLVDGLIAPGGRYLMTVGDDWQAINRFAGADLAVMTDFSDRFGPGQQVALTTTFRCSQVICDVASQFVAKNRRQLDKAMQSVHPENRGSPVEIVFAEEPRDAVEACLRRVAKEAGSAGASVLLLGRYGFERRDAFPAKVPANLQVEFRTIHSSKGAESDYVIIPGMNSGTYGFPSTIADDPVLDLVMGDLDTFDHAEERRLLYVALTRARRGVYLIASESRPSPFVLELLEGPNPPSGSQLVVQVDELGQPIAASKLARPCPRGDGGTLVRRTGPYGRFFGCSNFPGCDYKENNNGNTDGLAGAITLCPRCHAGKLGKRNGKTGTFLGCSAYPACRYTRNE